MDDRPSVSVARSACAELAKVARRDWALIIKQAEDDPAGTLPVHVHVKLQGLIISVRSPRHKTTYVDELTGSIELG
jgi:hypothetical protein